MLRRNAPTAAVSRLILAVLVAGTIGCADVMGGDLAIQGTASTFQVAIPKPFPNTRYQLKVAIINFSTDASGAALQGFVDGVGHGRQELGTRTSDGVSGDPLPVPCLEHERIG